MKVEPAAYNDVSRYGLLAYLPPFDRRMAQKSDDKNFTAALEARIRAGLRAKARAGTEWAIRACRQHNIHWRAPAADDPEA